MSATLDRPLGHLRVLELPGPVPMLFGRMFADLGAAVIKVEPPTGDPSRRLPPFARTEDGAEQSLFWAAYAPGKATVTLDLESEAGRAELQRLAAEADVLVEAETPGRMDALGAGYAALSALNPRLVYTAITPFGQTGPYAAWQGSDLVHFAMSGYLHMTGAPDDRPIKPSAPYQSYFHAGMQSFAATLIALWTRRQTGRGAFVDQAMRDTGIWMLTHTYQFWDLLGVNLKRQGASRDMGGVLRLPSVWTVADGYIVWLFQTGHTGGSRMFQLVEWMHSEGKAPDWLREIDWPTFDLLTAGPEMNARLTETFAGFFRTKTRRELFDWALPRGVMLAPVQGLRDVLDDPQLAARESFRLRDLWPSGPTGRLPGPPVRIRDAVWEPRPAPLAWESAAADPAPAAEPRGALPLAGLTVLDFSTTVAGPSAVRHLADFGARVIKIESQVHPDTLRAATPYKDRVAGPNRSGYFSAYNAGKNSFSLNMQLPEARAFLRQLVERADILVEAYVPGVMERWGLGVETLHEWNPRLIIASHCLQGQTGPFNKHRGYGQIAGAMTGWYDLTGYEGGEPLGPYSAYTDFICWPFLLSSLLVALQLRERTGKGQRIDHAQVESSVHYLAAPLLDLQLNGRALTRRGNRVDDVCPNNAYPCQGDDRWVAITAQDDAAFQRLCAALDLPDLAADPGLATLAGRLARAGELDARIDERTRNEEPYALAQRLQEHGIAAGVVQRAEDLFNDPQLQHRRFFTRLPHAELGDHAVLTQSFRISGIEAGPHRAAPLMGEHTFEILTDFLGLDGDQIADLTAKGIFE